jgi:hypothetical protein
MKEYPESNYELSVSMIGVPDEPRLGELLPRAYLIQVNLIVTIAVVPWLPESPWPPKFPTSWDDWSDRDEAAAYLFATNPISIAPTDGPARDQIVIFPEYPELAHTVFWLPRAEHEALLVDVERAYETPAPDRLRLLELSDGPLVEFLRRDLARAALSAYKREILCLDSVEDDQ